jgi:hypothetical protein
LGFWLPESVFAEAVLQRKSASEKIGVKKLRFAVILGLRNTNLQCRRGKAFLDKR